MGRKRIVLTGFALAMVGGLGLIAGSHWHPDLAQFGVVLVLVTTGSWFMYQNSEYYEGN